MECDIVSQLSTGIHLIGDFAGQTGLCQSGRGFREMFKVMGIPVECLDLPLAPDRRIDSSRLHSKEFDYASPTSPTSLISWNGDAYPMLARVLPDEVFENRRIIGLWYWETEELPDSQRAGYDYVDEIWVTSRFVADTVGRRSPVPVRQFPQPLILPNPPSQPVLPQVLRNERFVFLFSFDFRSSRGRKNPEGVCEAFIRAFPHPVSNGPLCVLKSMGGLKESPLVYLDLKRQFGHREDILFLDGCLDSAGHDSLLDRANCYVSLHRSEGLGLTLMESMALGKPCIATAYSGNLDFMTEKNSWLIPYKKVPIGHGSWPYPAEQSWAEPDLELAALAMRQIYDHPQLAAETGALARKTVLHNHSAKAVSALVKEALQDASQTPPRPKPKPNHKTSEHPQPSGRAKAFLTLKESKVVEQKAREAISSLHSWRIPAELRESLQLMLEVCKLQRQTQSHILEDLGAIKTRLKNYDGSKLDGLLRNGKIMEDLLISMLMDNDP